MTLATKVESPEPSAKELFERWVKVPLKALRQLPNGDGAFIALGAAFSLYERFVKSSLAQCGSPEGPEEFRRFGALDFEIDEEVFRRFWEMYRDGIQHSLQPKRYKSGGIRWGWEVKEDHKGIPEIIQPEADLRIIQLDPWKFIDAVVARYESNPELIDYKDTWKLGKITVAAPQGAEPPKTWSYHENAPAGQAPPAPDRGTGTCPPGAIGC